MRAGSWETALSEAKNDDGSYVGTRSMARFFLIDLMITNGGELFTLTILKQISDILVISCDWYQLS